MVNSTYVPGYVTQNTVFHRDPSLEFLTFSTNSSTRAHPMLWFDDTINRLRLALWIPPSTANTFTIPYSGVSTNYKYPDTVLVFPSISTTSDTTDVHVLGCTNSDGDTLDFATLNPSGTKITYVLSYLSEDIKAKLYEMGILPAGAVQVDGPTDLLALGS